MGHALIIPNADFSNVAVTQVTIESKKYKFQEILNDFITVSGYTPNSIETTALEHLTTDLIRYNIWDKIDGLYLLLGTTYQTCRYNWKDAYMYNFIIDNSSTFSLTNEHRIDPSTFNCYVSDYYDIDVENFHSVHFVKKGPSSAPLMFPLSYGSTTPEKSIVMYNYYNVNTGINAGIRDNYTRDYTNNITFDLNNYYSQGSILECSGLFNRQNNTVKYASCEFSNILSFSNDGLIFIENPNNVYYLNGYSANTSFESQDRIMGFGKSLSDSQMVRYMQILNRYKEETANAY